MTSPHRASFTLGTVLSLWMACFLCLPQNTWAAGAVRQDHDPDDYLLQMVKLLTGPKDAPPHLRNRPPADYSDFSGDYAGDPGDTLITVGIGMNVNLPNPTKYYAVTGISLREKKNDPCKIALWGRMVDPRFRDDRNRKLAEYDFGNCNGTNLGKLNEKREKVDFEGRDNRFVRALRACSLVPFPGGGVPHRTVKGLQVWPAVVSATGAVEPLGEDDVKSVWQPNCPQGALAKDDPASRQGWDAFVACPEDQLVTGLRVSHTSEYITGIAVNCKSVRSLRAPSAPIRDGQGW